MEIKNTKEIGKIIYLKEKEYIIIKIEIYTERTLKILIAKNNFY